MLRKQGCLWLGSDAVFWPSLSQSINVCNRCLLLCVCVCVCVCASLFCVHVSMFMYIVEDLEKFGVTEFIQFVLDEDFFFFFLM